MHLAATAADQGRITVTREMLNVQWEAVSLYPAGYFTRQIPIQASLTIPGGWRAATALRPTGSDGGRIDYGVVNYEVLQDSPVFAGKYFRTDDLGHGVALNTVADAPKELEVPAEVLAKHRALVDQALKLFGARHFDHYDFLHAVTNRMVVKSGAWAPTGKAAANGWADSAVVTKMKGSKARIGRLLRRLAAR